MCLILHFACALSSELACFFVREKSTENVYHQRTISSSKKYRRIIHLHLFFFWNSTGFLSVQNNILKRIISHETRNLTPELYERVNIPHDDMEDLCSRAVKDVNTDLNRISHRRRIFRGPWKIINPSPFWDLHHSVIKKQKTYLGKFTTTTAAAAIAPRKYTIIC